MAKRIKIDAPMLTHEEVVTVTGEIAAAAHALALDAERMNKKVDTLKRQHEEKQAALSAVIRIKTELLERWANANPQQFGERRSIDFPRAVIGYRLTTPRVETTKGVTHAAAIEQLAREPNGAQYIRVKAPELNKPAIIAARETDAELFSRAGIVVTQGETFFVSPKTDGPAEAPPQ